MLTVSLLVCAMMALAAANDEPTVIPTAPACREGFKDFNGRCYLVVSDELTFADAEKNCMKVNGHLATVHNVVQDNIIQRMIAASSPNNPASWIGGSDCQQDNVFIWMNGKESNYRNWCPSNVPGYKHGCILMNNGVGKCWATHDCSELNPSVCTYDQ